MDLQGKVGLVTGASRGVGAAVAVALARAGCLVACAARSTRDAPQRTPGTLDETVARIEAAGGTGYPVPTNLASQDEVIAMVAQTVDRFGGLDILVNNAAVTFLGDLQIPLKRHDLIMDVNLRAPLVAIREAVPHMTARGGGSIINVSSVAALYPYGDNMSYGMSKIALERLTIDAAKQLQGSKVAVNCFRIDIPVASEGFIANTEGIDRSNWEPCEEEWAPLFGRSDLAVSPVHSFTDAVTNVHSRARGSYVEVDGVPQPAPAPRFSRTPLRPPKSASLPGSDAAEALQAWGLTSEEIERYVLPRAVIQVGSTRP